MLKLIFAFLNIFLIGQSSSGASWDYLHQGKDWELGVCKDNHNEQSPINVYSMPDIKKQLKGEVEVTGGKVSAEVVNNGHTIQLNPQGETFLKASLEDSGGHIKDYNSLQFHFHSPSEHFVNGKQMDLEMHVVCENLSPIENNRKYGVVAFLFQEDSSVPDTPFLKNIIGKFSTHDEEEVKTDTSATAEEQAGGHRILSAGGGGGNAFEFKFSELFKLLPKENLFWHYEGGLTTPTCDEAVNWYLNKNIIRVNTHQLKAFRALWVTDAFNGNSVDHKAQGNNRILQDLGSRSIYSGKYEIVVEVPPNWDEQLLLLMLYVMVMVSWMMVIVVIVYCCQAQRESVETSKIQDSEVALKQIVH